MSGLTTRVLTSLVWVFTNIVTKNLLQFVRMYILWRILDARDFGLNSMVWTVINGFSILQDLGFQNALIQKKTDVEAAVSVTWYANVAIRTVLYAILFLAAPFVAEFYRESELTPILRFASLTVFLNAFGNANEALLRKNFQQKRLLAVELCEMLTLTVVQIATAYSGFAVWSLAWGAVSGAAMRSFLLWILAPIRVGRWDGRVAREMWRFGAHMSLSTVGLYLMKNMDYMMVGRVFGPVVLGYYTLAFKLSDLIAVNIVRLLGSVLFPAFAAIGHDIDRLRAAWLRSERLSMLVVMPMGVALMAFAPEIVAQFFPKGEGFVAWPMAILTVFALCRAVGSQLGDVAKGIGRPWILTRVVWWHVAVMAAALAGVCSLPGLEPWQYLIGVSCAVSGSALFAISFSLYLTSREVKYTARQVAQALAPALVCGVVMAAAVLGGKALGQTIVPGAPPIAVLAVLGPLSAVVYCLAVIALFPATVAELKSLAANQRAARREKLARRGALTSGMGEAAGVK